MQLVLHIQVALLVVSCQLACCEVLLLLQLSIHLLGHIAFQFQLLDVLFKLLLLRDGN